jgi:tetratricopeptide (TPR) repeat protein
MGQDSPQPPAWRIWIQQGAAALGNARYSEAISAFQKASDANPQSPVPHIYLAIAWFQQYIPGAVSADNADPGHQAETELRRALDLDPVSWIAAAMLGQLTLSENRLEEAREWYRKASAVEPRNADTWCVLGAIAWRRWLGRGKPAPQPVLEEAISDFEKSVALDPVHEVAMQYLSLLLRERAGTRDRDEEKRQDLAAAEQWLRKSSDARAEKLQASIARVDSRPPHAGDPDPLLKQWALIAVMIPPPLHHHRRRRAWPGAARHPACPRALG